MADSHALPENANSRSVAMVGVSLTAIWAAQAWLAAQSTLPPLYLLGLVQSLAWLAFLWLARLPGALPGTLGWALGFRLLASLTQPIMEDDWARYLWDGWRFLSTGNPFHTAPSHFFTDPTVPELLQRRLSEINHPDLPTVYGPLLQLGFALAAWIAPGELWPWKMITLAADLGILGLVQRTFGSRAAALYGWCPLVIHETCVNAHADVLAILPLVVAAWAHQRQRPWTTGIGLGLAISGKILALPAVPFLLGVRNFRGWVALVLTLVAAHAPFWSPAGLGSSLQTFAADWEFNSSLVGILGSVLPPGWARALALLLVAPFLALHFRKCLRNPTEMPRLDGVFGAVLVASAVVNPWYLLWMAPFVAAQPTFTAWTAMAAVLLSYATGLNLGINTPGPYSHPAWLRPVEYGFIAAAALWDGMRHLRSRQGPTVRTESSATLPG
jgi:alpha-1,6-mannosyltransferase